MNSVERIKHFAELPQEDEQHRRGDPASTDWPTEGKVSFQNVQLRYRPELPTVLRGLTFDVPRGTSVGIVGRTGAGKSSIVQALYRTVELCGGVIEIDGLDIRHLGLETVCCRHRSYNR